MVQTVKNPSAVQETCIQSLGGKDLLEEGMATHSGILGESHGQRSLAGYSACGHRQLDTAERLSTSHHDDDLAPFPKCLSSSEQSGGG